MQPVRYLRHQWEQRAAAHQANARGVLYGGLPDAVNAALGEWHGQLVLHLLLPGLPPKGDVLDIAAGYGRLSMIVRNARPDAGIVGIDLSSTYCRLYARDVGPAVCGDMQHLPFPDAMFDRIIVVTGLMYLDGEAGKKAVREIITRLRPGGLALFVDPGAEMIRMLRRIRPRLARTTTGGDGFSDCDYRALCAVPGAKVVAMGGNRAFTRVMPLLLLLGRWHRLRDAIARWAVRRDLSSGGAGTYVLHRWLMVQRES